MCSCSSDCWAPMRKWALRQNLEDSHGRWGQEESSGQKSPECSTRMWCNNLWFLLQAAQCVVGFLLLFPFFPKCTSLSCQPVWWMVLVCSCRVGWEALPHPRTLHGMCRSQMQTQLCPEGLWGGERLQPDLSVCAIRIDLQGILWKAELCLSFCMLRIISSFNYNSHPCSEPLAWRELFSPGLSETFGGSYLSTLQQVLGDHRLPVWLTLVTAALLLGVRAKQSLGCSVQGHKCCSSGHSLL